MMRVVGTELSLHPDRLLPPEPGVRAIARRLYDAVAELPLISPHGHVDPRLLLENSPFPDPATLFITPDHYVTRLLHADGVDLAELGVGQGPLSEDAARKVWRLLCEHWDVYRGTAVRYWLDAELVEIFGVTVRPSAETADEIYDQIAERLRRPEYLPRALYERFNLSVLVTTDDPSSDLADHAALAADPEWKGRVIPAFRPDRYLEPAQPGWVHAIAELAKAADVDTGDYRGYIQAFEQRRQYFIAHGATSADHSHPDARTDPLAPAEAARIYRAALVGEATADEAVAFRRHMLGEMGRMSCDDGLTMTLHPGVRRNHHTATFERFGADVGCDIPIRHRVHRRPATDAAARTARTPTSTSSSSPSTRRSGRASWRRWQASTRPCLAGVPWWFLDAPDAMRRFREAVTETAGFSPPRGSSTTPAHSARSPRATTCPDGSTPGCSRRLVARAPAPRGRGDPRRAVDLVTTQPTESSNCYRREAVPSARSGPGAARFGWSTSASATSTARTVLAHRTRARRGALGLRSVHRPIRKQRADSDPDRPGRPLHAGDPRGGRCDRFEVIGALVAGARRRRP